MKMTYSARGDALAIRLVDRVPGKGTKELAPDVYADFDADGRLLRIEILNASRFYDPAELEKLASPVVWLSLADAAAESQLAVTTIRNQIVAGRLAGEKRGRDWVVARHELWNYLENRAPQGRPGQVDREAQLQRKATKKSSRSPRPRAKVG
jgi:uncharacterized protein YuzE